jgi:DNA-binding NarL/FixJ family response regulator
MNLLFILLILSNMKKPTVIIVDDHKALRDGLSFMLNSLEIAEVVGQASNGKEFLDILENLKPDIVLMDINMPIIDGVEATKRARQIYPDLKILVLSMHGEEQYYNSMIHAGVMGFILKESGADEIQAAIQSICSGKPYFSQELLLRLLKKKQGGDAVNLTQREYEILKLICKGLSNQEIADKLFLSVRTVEKHRSDLLVKTDSPNSISLAVYAIKNGFVEI